MGSFATPGFLETSPFLLILTLILSVKEFVASVLSLSLLKIVLRICNLIINAGHQIGFSGDPSLNFTKGNS